MKVSRLLFVLLLFAFHFSYAQDTLLTHLSDVKKGEFVILEVRLNMEDEFRTLEGRDSQGLARISLFNGDEGNKPLITKGFKGFDQVVNYLNEIKSKGFVLSDTYSIRGESLLITHYVFEKIKK